MLGEIGFQKQPRQSKFNQYALLVCQILVKEKAFSVCTQKKQLLVRMLLLPHHIIMIIYCFQSHFLTWKPQHNKKGRSQLKLDCQKGKQSRRRYGNVKEWESKKATLQSSTKLCRENNILQKKNASCHDVFGTLDLSHLHE